MPIKAERYIMREIIKPWFKSSESNAEGNCVEAQFYSDGSVDIRHSKNPSGPVITYTRDEWAAFLGGAGKGEFNLPV